MIQFKNISHNYGLNSEALVLKNVSFSIEDGECVGLTGPSGSGKSTLAYIAAGHIPPASGRIIVDGKDRTGRQSREVFLIHQESDLFPWQKVKRQISFAMGRKDEKRVASLINLVKLSGFEGYFPNQLSGGMKKRLAIARALAVNPKLLILDEAFSSLDSNLKMDLYSDLKRIWEITGTTILLITHDYKDLENLANREIKLTDHKPTKILEIIQH
jgi:ABC-type nitrate/sulfonate/bicarbonate transport system ATPase subunit